MCEVQQSNSIKKFTHLTICQRIIAAGVFLIIFFCFFVLFLSSRGLVDLSLIFGVCGFKQAYGLPCPGCYITHSAQLFVQGRIQESFYVQPAGSLFCFCFAAAGVFALLMALFGIDFGVLRQGVVRRLL